MPWSLYENSKFLEPLKFSNGKTQEDVMNEVLGLIKEGKKVIFIKGMCGTGKSAIALNLAKNLGQTSVIVPGKNLQNQYKKDYENDKYILKNNGERLRISVMTGRNNHECLFIRDNKDTVPEIRKEINLRLDEIFENKIKDAEELKKKDNSAGNPDIPCRIDIKEKNWRKIRDYLKQNKSVNLNIISEIKDVKRLPLASVCPYWSPVLPEVYEPRNLNYRSKREYMGLNNTKFIIYQRKPGCGFYEQFNSYIDSDVIVFNSAKYKLESAINRKPMTEAEVIDECDEFLDSFTNEKEINFDILQSALIRFLSENEEAMRISDELSKLTSYIKKSEEANKAALSGEIIPLKNTPVAELFRLILDSNEFSSEIDEESYLFEVEETAGMFRDFLDESYMTFSKIEGNLIANIVTANLSKKFQKMKNENKLLILMSGTLHSEKVLGEVFGIEDFETVDAETEQPGEISIVRTGLEFECSHKNFSSGRFSRADYFKALDKCVAIAKKPALVHVSAFHDLPSESEISELGIRNLISREELRNMQNSDKDGMLIERFKKKETDILFTTRCARGVDFPGEQCNSIVFTKYPYPHPDEPFWKILKKTSPNQYWDFYNDKAKRELLQKIYRGLRFKGDHVFLLSPDERVLRGIEKGNCLKEL
ncbi:MAG TPA: helicase C-terminal domain-containing protein [Candidatus Omnitrophota bacterium]|nr:helicase C-terminal domain-containing protein [Candidatus Omnitrophota bacterium]